MRLSEIKKVRLMNIAVAQMMVLSLFYSGAVGAVTTTSGAEPATQTDFRLYEQSTSLTPGAPLAATNVTGELSQPGDEFRLRTVLNLPDVEIAYIGSGREYNCVLTTGSDVYCWGDNIDGNFGSDTPTGSLEPVKIDFDTSLGGEHITQLSVGYYHACAVTNAGSGYCWGYGNNGRLGNNSTATQRTPVRINTYGDLAGQSLRYIAAATDHTCAIAEDGRAYCWGYNIDGQLGRDRLVISTSLVPIAVTDTGPIAGKNLVQIDGGGYFSCALDDAGAAYCWGSNYSGGLGSGDPIGYYFEPVEVDMTGAMAGKTFTHIDVGADSTCALASDQQAYCWGWNPSGNSGDGTYNAYHSPNPVDTSGALAGKTIQVISTHTTHTCAVTTDNLGYCWGSNWDGELAINDAGGNDELFPVAIYADGVLNNDPLALVSTGYTHSCFVTTGHRILCSGDNGSGRLGDGTTTSSVQLVGGNTLSYTMAAGSNAFRLQYALKSIEPCENVGTYTYADVGTVTPISFAPVSGVANDESISTEVSDPVVGANVIAQSVQTDTSAVSVLQDVDSGEYALWDFSLADNTASSTQQTYCLRLAYADSSPIEAYTNVASVTTAASEDPYEPPTVALQETSDTTPLINGTYDQSNSTELEVQVGDVVYVLGDSEEISAENDTWQLQIVDPLDVGTYDVAVTSTMVDTSQLVDTTDGELIITSETSGELVETGISVAHTAMVAVGLMIISVLLGLRKIRSHVRS